MVQVSGVAVTSTDALDFAGSMCKWKSSDCDTKKMYKGLASVELNNGIYESWNRIFGNKMNRNRMEYWENYVDKRQAHY